MRTSVLLSFTLAMAVSSADYGTNKRISDATAPSSERSEQASPVKIRLVMEGATITGTLEDNATARDFASLLPLTVSLEDYAGTEKIADLPKKLSTEGAPAGFDPSIGDISYYAPWGNLAIFYRDFGFSRGLIKLGAVESGGAGLNSTESMRATIEIVED
jgi:hypothetical protein